MKDFTKRIKEIKCSDWKILLMCISCALGINILVFLTAYFMYDFKILSITSSISSIITFFDFQSLQNVILGLLAILIPLLIHVFDNYKEYGRVYVNHALGTNIGIGLLPRLVIATSLVLVFLSINQDNINIFIFFVVIVIMVGTLLSIIDTIKRLYKFIISNDTERFYQFLSANSVILNDKVRTWGSVWGKSHNNHYEKKFLKLFFKQLNKLVDDITKKNNKGDYDEINLFYELLQTCTHNDINFLEETWEDKIKKRKWHRFVNRYYYKELPKELILIYKKAFDKKNDLLKTQIERGYERIMEVCFMNNDYLPGYFLLQHTFDTVGEINDEEFQGQFLEFFFGTLSTGADGLGFLNDKQTEKLFSHSGNVLRKYIKENDTFSRILQTHLLKYVYGIKDDKLAGNVLSETFGNNEYNVYWILLLLRYIGHGNNIPEHVAYLDIGPAINIYPGEDAEQKYAKLEKKRKEEVLPILKLIIQMFNKSIAQEMVRKKEHGNKEKLKIYDLVVYLQKKINEEIESTPKEKQTVQMHDYKDMINMLVKHLHKMRDKESSKN